MARWVAETGAAIERYRVEAAQAGAKRRSGALRGSATRSDSAPRALANEPDGGGI